MSINKWEKLSKDLAGVDEAGDFLNIKAGIYMAKIVSVEDNATDEYINVVIDLIEGEYKDFFKKMHENNGPDWNFNGQKRQYYKDSALAFFKRFITVVEKSNEGYNFAKEKGNLESLKGKMLVAVYADQESPKPNADDNNKPSIYPTLQDFRSVPSFRDGKIKLPDNVIPLNAWGKNKYKENLDELGVATVVVASKPETTDTVINIDDLPF